MASSMKGRHHTAETKAKISSALKGKPQTEEHKEKRVAQLRGRKLSPERVAQMSAAVTSEQMRATALAVTPEGRARGAAKRSLISKMKYVVQDAQRELDKVHKEFERKLKAGAPPVIPWCRRCHLYPSEADSKICGVCTVTVMWCEKHDRPKKIARKTGSPYCKACKRERQKRMMGHVGPISPMAPPRMTVKEVIARDGDLCAYCGTKCVESVEWAPNQATVDHVRAVVLGGTDDPANLVLACSICNSTKRSRDWRWIADNAKHGEVLLVALKVFPELATALGRRELRARLVLDMLGAKHFGKMSPDEAQDAITAVDLFSQLFFPDAA